MIKDLWQRFRKRRERVLSEVAEIHLQMAREGKVAQPPPLLFGWRAKSWVIVVFWVVIVAVVYVLWFFMKGGLK